MVTVNNIALRTEKPVSSTGETGSTPAPTKKHPIDLFAIGDPLRNGLRLVAQGKTDGESEEILISYRLDADTPCGEMKCAKDTFVFKDTEGRVRGGILAESYFFEFKGQIIELPPKTRFKLDKEGKLIEYLLPEKPQASSPNWPAIGTLGGGIVALGSAVALGIMAQQEWNAFNKRFEEGRLTVNDASLRDAAKLHVGLANTLYAVGGVLVVTSGVLFFYEVKF